MTEERLVLAELLEKAGDGDFLRAVAEAVVQLLMETDVEGLIGAGRHERSGDRTTYRNGYRDRTLDTRLGSLQLRIPKPSNWPAGLGLRAGARQQHAFQAGENRGAAARELSSTQRAIEGRTMDLEHPRHLAGGGPLLEQA